jgi:FRG domain
MQENEPEEVEAVTVAGEGQELTFPGVKSPLFGDLPAPKTISDFWRLLAHLTAGGTRIAGWRGHSDITWAIHSSAVRRILAHGALPSDLLPSGSGVAEGSQITPDINEPGGLDFYLQQYENYLLNAARVAGHGFQRGRDLSDLELLAVLQHYGAATRLLDFSRNVGVALWFAASENPEKCGLLIAVDVNRTKPLNSQKEISKPVNETLYSQPIPYAFSWQPQQLFDRMEVQQSFFIFSKAEKSDWGSLALPGPNKKDGGLVLVAVPPELKSDLVRLQHQRMFGFTGLSLFPDLEGFSRFQSAQSPFLLR